VLTAILHFQHRRLTTHKLPLGPRGDPIEVLREIEKPILVCTAREYRWVSF